ncbi:MAG: hypothetical protein RIS87_1408 [Pseudomonadota bacterium]|jgi:iron complex outermembrane receptor protein
MKNNKITFALFLAFSSNAMADINIVTRAVAITANPLIESIDVDAYSSTAAVVSDSQLRDQNAVDLASALRRTPGVQISRYNPVGAFGGDQGGAVYIRGMGVSRPGSEIKTYIDDIPFYMGVWGHPLLDLLPVNGMQSITIYKSPQPQINGNNFASINLETKRATEDGIHGDARISGGSFGTVVQQANIVGRTGAVDFMLAQGYAKSNGHRPNSDGELKNVMGRLGAQLNDHWRTDVSFLAVDNKASDPQDARGVINPITPEYKSKATMLTASISHRYENLSGSFKIYSNRGEGNLYNDNRPNVGWGTFLSDFNMSGLRLKEQLTAWTGGTILAGIDIDRISGKVNGQYTGGNVNMPSFSVTSPYFAVSQAIKLNDDWNLVPSVGMRFYSHSEYNAKSAPHAGLSLESEKATFFANVTRGINYPGLEGPALQAALPFFFNGTSWKNLSAEELNHKEIGLKLRPTETTQININLFRDDIKNRYAYDFSLNSFQTMTLNQTVFQNIGGYHTNGAELSIKQKIGQDWTAFGGLTLLNPSLDSLPYTPKTAFTAGLNGNVGAVKIALDAQYQSQVFALNLNRDTSMVNNEKVASFTVVNIRTSYPMPTLGKKGEVFLAIENLFDQKYAYRPGYAMPGISGQIGLSASF